jgi:hypothetical protein
VTRPHSLLVTVLPVLLTTSVAAAADPPDLRQATQLMHEGKLEADAGRFESARQRYALACAIAATPRCLRSLAHNDLRSNHPLDALRHFHQELAHPNAGADLTPDNLTLDRDMMRDAYAQTGHIQIHAPESAIISVDGQPLADRLPADRVVDVLVGAHVVEARVDDRIAHVEITATKGEAAVADLHIDPPAAPPASPPPVITAPPAAPAKRDTPLDTGAPQWWTPTRTAGALTAAGGVVSYALSGVFASQSRTAHQSVQSLRPCDGICTTLQSQDNTDDRDKTLSWLLFGVGTAAVATGAVLFLWPSHHTIVAPLTTSNTTGLQVTGDF